MVPYSLSQVSHRGITSGGEIRKLLAVVVEDCAS